MLCPVVDNNDGQAPLNVVIPIGGNGTRFGQQGYRYPKPLINIVGRPMLLWIIDHLSLRPCDTLWIAINEAIDENFQLAQLLAKTFPKLDIQVLRLLHQTKGAAETLYITTQSMQAKHLHRRTVSIDCDTIYWTDILQLARSVAPGHGACVYFVDQGDRPLYSYLKTEHDNGLEKIVDIKEKTAISNKANTGAYIFPSAELLRTSAAEYLDVAQQPNGHVGEYFTSRLVGLMIRSSIPFAAIPVAEDHFSIVGTPDQLKAFLALIKSTQLPLGRRARKSRFCFDLDMTLVGAPRVAGDYSTCPPIASNIRLAQQLHEAGHHIIIQTARRMKTHHGNVGAVIADIGTKTFEQLARYKIPFDEIHFGKPYADVYIDDLAVNANLDTVQEVGWLLDEGGDDDGGESSGQSAAKKAGMVDARHFNTIQIINDKVVKSSKHDNILGELFFYSHMPDEIAQLYPRVYAVDFIPETQTFTMQMERCTGLTFSHLLAGRSITSGRLSLFLRCLHRVHSTRASLVPRLDVPASLAAEFAKHPQKMGGSTDDVDVYANYGSKLRRRYRENAECYAELGPLAGRLFDRIRDFLDAYEANGMALPAAVIHGDPVFSNAILSPDETAVKLIDVRCQLGSTLTAAGDINYDLAKVLQSLCGYDHALLLLGKTKNPPVDALDGHGPVLQEADATLLENLRAQFFDFVRATYPASSPRLEATLYGLTAALFLTLIPLHGPKLRKVFLRLCEETMDRADRAG